MTGIRWHHFAKAGEMNTGFVNFGIHTAKWPDQAHCPGAVEAVCTPVLPFPKAVIYMSTSDLTVSNSNPSMIPSELLMKSRFHRWLMEPSVCLLLWLQSWDHTWHDHLLHGWPSCGIWSLLTSPTSLYSSPVTLTCSSSRNVPSSFRLNSISPPSFRQNTILSGLQWCSYFILSLILFFPIAPNALLTGVYEICDYIIICVTVNV